MFESGTSRHPRDRSSARAPGTSGKTGHVGSDSGRAYASASGRPQALALGEQDERLVQDFAVGQRAFELDSRLDLVVALQELVDVGLRPETRKLPADAAVPVDERPVTVEGRPASALRWANR